MAGPQGVWTNTLHVSLPHGKGQQAASALFRQYGEVASFRVLPTEEEFGFEVIYFDIRAAASAHSAFGDRCRLAPQTGSRSVRMPGEAQLVHKDVELISGVRNEEGSFVLDFYDVRDATRFSAGLNKSGEIKAQRLSSGLETIKAVPGLTKGLTSCTPVLSSPPGLEGATKEAEKCPPPPSKATHRVTLEDLPSAILSKPMFKAVLQQAGLHSTVVSFSTSPGPMEEETRPEEKTASKRGFGKQSKTEGKLQSSLGSATIYFSSRHGAERCRHHFHGCQWDALGAVHATVEALPTASRSTLPKAVPTSLKILSAKAPVFEPSSEMPMLSRLSADAPDFEPVEKTVTKEKSEKQASAKLSPAAPEFHPVAPCFAVYSSSKKQQAAGFALMNLHTASETSTDAGESSELEDDSRGLGIFASVGTKLGPGSLLNTGSLLNRLLNQRPMNASAAT